MEKIEIQFRKSWNIGLLFASILGGCAFAWYLLTYHEYSRYYLFLEVVPIYQAYMSLSHLVWHKVAISITDANITLNEDGLITSYAWLEIRNIFFAEKSNQFTATHRNQIVYTEISDQSSLGRDNVYLCVEPLEITKKQTLSGIKVNTLDGDEESIARLILSKAPAQSSNQWQISTFPKPA